MRNVIYTLLAVITCIVLSACGTARAIVGDYADDYVIKNIRPLSAVSGESVIFEADICTNAGAVVDPESGDVTNAKFTWDFGGGAQPNMSFEQTPTVTIRDGIRAPYTGSLTIRGGCVPEGEEISATFTLDVAPLTVLAVTPQTGVAGGSATFSALIGSGVATTYAWDFGGSAIPGGSTAKSPTVTFDASAGGIFHANLIVSNDFEVVEFPFTISVIPATPDV